MPIEAFCPWHSDWIPVMPGSKVIFFITDAPRVSIAISPNSLTQRAGEGVSFTCKVEAYPSAVNWQ